MQFFNFFLKLIFLFLNNEINYYNRIFAPINKFIWTVITLYPRLQNFSISIYVIVLEGDFGYADPYENGGGGRVTGKQRLQCELTLREGRIVYDWNARAAVDWKTLRKDYGVRKTEFIVLPPKKN